METDNALRHADNRVVVVLALTFAALVFLIGIVSNDVPSEIPMVQSSFDVAPPVVDSPAPAPVADGDPQPATQPNTPFATQLAPQLAHFAPAARTTAPSKDDRWYADETAGGTRPDSQH